MNFLLSPEVEKLRLEIKNFVSTHILPLENDKKKFDSHENINEKKLIEMRKSAQEKGLWALSMPVERGGRGVNHVGMAACYEEMNRSIFGPVVFNAAAPDDGNMYILNKVANDRQKKECYNPLLMEKFAHPLL